jgi:vesicular inhibitory amino acid transporter
MMKPKYGYPVFLNNVAIWMIVITPLTKFGLCSRPLHIAVEGFMNLAPAAAVVAPPPPRPRAVSVSQALGSAISQTLSNVATSDYAITDDSSFSIPKAPSEPIVQVVEVDSFRESSKGVLRLISRTLLTASCVTAAIVLPGFEKVMAFLGSFSAFLICIILPVSYEVVY